MRRFLSLIIFSIFLASVLSSDQANALGYKYGLFGGYNYTSFGFGELPEGLSANGNGGYVGLEGGVFLSGQFFRPGIEISPAYVISHVNQEGESSRNIHSIFVPAYLTFSFGENNPFVDVGVGAGPLFLDLSKSTNTDLGIFAKVSPVVEVSRRLYLGPHIQFFWDMTAPSDTNIWGILAGISLEIY